MYALVSLALKKPPPHFSVWKTVKDCDWVRSFQYEGAVLLDDDDLELVWEFSEKKDADWWQEKRFEWCPCGSRVVFDGLEVVTGCYSRAFGGQTSL